MTAGRMPALRPRCLEFQPQTLECFIVLAKVEIEFSLNPSIRLLVAENIVQAFHQDCHFACVSFMQKIAGEGYS